MLKALRVHVFLLFGLFTTATGSAEERPLTGPAWQTVRAWPADEAVQAAAANESHLFAITNSRIGKYDRQTGARVAVSTGAASHLNSGFFWQGTLLAAHSNYPALPEQSQIFQLDVESMQLTCFHDFGDYGGSLTWAVHHDAHWWCHFAKYGSENDRSFLVKLTEEWQEIQRWSLPPELIGELGSYSLSGGIWWNQLLHVTGHDAKKIYRLRAPSDGKTLEWIDTEAAPFTGQGIAIDPQALHTFVGIDRANRRLLVASREHPTPPAPRLPRESLLVYRDASNESQQGTGAAAWERRKAEIERGVAAIMGPLPGQEKRCELNTQIMEEVDCGTFVRRLITYQSEPGSRVPAYLCIPKSLLSATNTATAPAALCLHSTDNVVGHGVVVGLSERANRSYASELAERGWVTLAPSYPLLANYQPDLHALGWESGTLKAVWDNLRGVDLLLSLPFVGGDNVAAIGHSLGGHNAVYTAFHDQRVDPIVSSCGLDSFLDYYDGNPSVWEPERGWTQTRYMPRLARYQGRLEEIPFDFHELIASLAPRKVLISAPLGDDNFRAQSVARVVQAAKPIYQLYGASDNLQWVHPDCDHDFPPAVREQAYQWLRDPSGSDSRK